MNSILYKPGSVICIQNNTVILRRHQFSVFLSWGSILHTWYSINTLKINEIACFLGFRQFAVLPFLFSVFFGRQVPQIRCIAILFGCKILYVGFMKRLKFYSHYRFSLSIQH